jgi:hypothetical protein
VSVIGYWNRDKGPMYCSTSAVNGMFVARPVVASIFQILPLYVVSMAELSLSHAGVGIAPNPAVRWPASCWTSIFRIFSSPDSRSRSIRTVRASYRVK